MELAPPTRWETDWDGRRWRSYADRFEKLYREGEDVEGEARFVDALLPRHADVLDGGCGTGRIAAALHRMGHRAVGADRDQALVEIARDRYAGTPFVVADLLTVQAEELQVAGGSGQFDVIALPGNVMVFLAPGTEQRVLANLAAPAETRGRLVAGFATDREYAVDDFVADLVPAGFGLEHRFATWQTRSLAGRCRLDRLGAPPEITRLAPREFDPGHRRPAQRRQVDSVQRADQG